MGYDHTLDATIQLKESVSRAIAFSILKPLANYFNWTEDQVVNKGESCNESIVLYWEQNQVIGFEIHTTGEVIAEFDLHVEQLVENLAAHALPGYIELRNYDTPELAFSVKLVWYGPPEDVDRLMASKAQKEALDLLKRSGLPEHAISEIKHVVRRFTVHQTPIVSHYRNFGGIGVIIGDDGFITGIKSNEIHELHIKSHDGKIRQSMRPPSGGWTCADVREALNLSKQYMDAFGVIDVFLGEYFLGGTEV